MLPLRKDPVTCSHGEHPLFHLKQRGRGKGRVCTGVSWQKNRNAHMNQRRVIREQQGTVTDLVESRMTILGGAGSVGMGERVEFL